VIGMAEFDFSVPRHSETTFVDGGDWSFVSLRGADLSSATFTDVRMREADQSVVIALALGMDVREA
jgi:uncharacterized protein YjbI with pentapeptide repeats